MLWKNSLEVALMVDKFSEAFRQWARSQIRLAFRWAFRWAKTSVWAFANPKSDLNIPIRTERIAQSQSTAERFAER